MYQVAQTNAFIRQTSDAELDAYGIDQATREEIQVFRAEARFLRALSYYHALDLFGNPPFITEDDPVGAFLPEQISRADLFSYIEGELLAIENEMVPARQNEYARADRAAVWTLLAKLYLNAEEYTGTARNAEVITYTENIIGAGYSLVEDYQKLFLADNNSNGAQNEIIFPIAFDGLNTRSFGGMTFLIRAAIGGDMVPADYGVNSGWGGLRTTPEFVNLFPGGADSEDGREMFFTEGQRLEINDITRFKDGYAIEKFRNIDSKGNAGSDPTGEHPDTDFPMFRLADVYLMYAEAVLRGGGGSQSQALSYINELRERAYGDDSGDISSNELTLNFILAERGRELYWEAHRRTDLVRFGQFTTQGVWAWKGNVPQGTTTAGFRDIYPIPASDLGVNTKLTQNPGY
jgi:starch-binding outer membrane protein, SusD/RagB family